MESDATPYCLVGSVLSVISSVVISDENQVARMDIEHVEKISLVAARGTKRNLRKWIVKKYGSQVDEVHMTQFTGFLAAKKKVG